MSVTRAVNTYVSATAGVPASSPELDSVIPPGSPTPGADHVTAPAPPWYSSCAECGRAAVQSGSVVVVTANAVGKIDETFVTKPSPFPPMVVSYTDPVGAVG